MPYYLFNAKFNFFLQVVCGIPAQAIVTGISMNRGGNECARIS
jgi:hypothetical protein